MTQSRVMEHLVNTVGISRKDAKLALILTMRSGPPAMLKFGSPFFV
jgi:hypothetical protein